MEDETVFYERYGYPESRDEDALIKQSTEYHMKARRGNTNRAHEILAGKQFNQVSKNTVPARLARFLAPNDSFNKFNLMNIDNYGNYRPGNRNFNPPV
jgi:hypothetical protein